MTLTRPSQVSTRIRADLVSGRLGSGQKILQEHLAARYGVSRIPLREALNELQAEGLVVHKPNRGYFVAELRAADMREVYRLRELLEAEAITQACRNLSDIEIERIADSADSVIVALTSNELSTISAANRSFHFAIFEAAQMPRLTRILKGLWDATEVYRGLYFRDVANHRHIADEHAAVLRAVRDRDSNAAIAAQSAHRARSLAHVSDRLPE